jgi:hypothetical protein
VVVLVVGLLVGWLAGFTGLADSAQDSSARKAASSGDGCGAGGREYDCREVGIRRSTGISGGGEGGWDDSESVEDGTFKRVSGSTTP